MRQRVRVHLQVPQGRVLLQPGEHVVGRSPECHIVLASARASRRHARIVVDEFGASIEDLQSANGVFVNGTPVERERRPLEADDFVVIGDQALEVSIEPMSEAFDEQAPVSVVGSMPTLPPYGVTSKAHGLDLLASVADRALNSGYPDRAERALDDWLRTTLVSARAGKPSEPRLNELALSFAQKLACALASPRWVDYALELLAELGKPMANEYAAELDQAIEAVGVAAPWLDAYSAKLGMLPRSEQRQHSLDWLGRWRARAR